MSIKKMRQRCQFYQKSKKKQDIILELEKQILSMEESIMELENNIIQEIKELRKIVDKQK